MVSPHTTNTIDAETSHDRPAEGAAAEPLATEELLVEEISIDGMCGVY